MNRRSGSPMAAANAKRQRTQSPEIEFEELTQAEMDALDEYEEAQSQRISSSSQPVRMEKHRGSDDTMHDSSSDDPFGPGPSTSASGLPGFGSAALFTSAAHINTPEADHDHDDSSSQSAPEPDYDSWFQSSLPENSMLAFQPAAAFVPGFQTASNGVIMPSTDALAKAQALLNEWEGDEDFEDDPDAPAPALPPPGLALFQTASSLVEGTPSRPVLRNVQNVPPTPGTPSPAAFTRPSVSDAPRPAPPSPVKSASPPKPVSAPKPVPTPPSHPKPVFAPLPKPVSTPLKAKTFKPPFLKPSPLQSSFAPASQNNSTFATPVRPKHPLAAAPISASSFSTPKSTSSFATPLSRPKNLGMRSTPAKFVTPFKAGMRPGEPGHTKLTQQAAASPSRPLFTPASSSRLPAPTPKKTPKFQGKTFFNIDRRQDRETLATCGLVPRWYELSSGELPHSMIQQLEQMHPSIAPYFSFYGPPSENDSTPSSSQVQIGPQEAFERLKKKGCSLVTQEWVDNHWALILWKLAGLAHLDPERESCDEKRWCWEEAFRQLLYRYEREINRGIRPPLKMIATQDSPSVFPMVLCISDINWLEETRLPDGSMSDPVAELELTDGWYLIRAQTDAPLMRAINKRTLRIGRKLAVVNARLDSERKDPQEILEAYSSIKLVLSGNSTHLAPWHAKLGFQREVPIATMSSLTRDGGMIAVMDVIIKKTYPIAYIEFTMEDGQKVNNGPMVEEEEVRLRNKWERKRENEHAKLYEEHQKNARRYAGYADRLRSKAGSGFRPTEAGPPDRVDDYYDQLEEDDDAKSVISRISASDAGWLAIRIRSQMEKQQETMGEEIEKDLNDICPPREVRNFRVLEVQDAVSNRRDANRLAQLTVWDVLNVCLTEGRKPGTFEVGERCRVTHLQPTQHSAWMGHSPGDQIFMSSTRNTRFTRIRGG